MSCSLVVQISCRCNVLIAYRPAFGRLRMSTGSAVMTRSTCATSLPPLASTKLPGLRDPHFPVSNSVAFAIDTEISLCSLRLKLLYPDARTNRIYCGISSVLTTGVATGIWERKSSFTQPTRLQARSKAVCMAARYTREFALQAPEQSHNFLVSYVMSTVFI